MVERLWAERGVESLFGGSNHAGRSMKRTLQPRQSHNGKAEPVMSRRRLYLLEWLPDGTAGFLGVRAAARVESLAGNRRGPSARAGVRQETGWISRW
jgi:hypothetical protein